MSARPCQRPEEILLGTEKPHQLQSPHWCANSALHHCFWENVASQGLQAQEKLEKDKASPVILVGTRMIHAITEQAQSGLSFVFRWIQLISEWYEHTMPNPGMLH